MVVVSGWGGWFVGFGGLVVSVVSLMFVVVMFVFEMSGDVYDIVGVRMWYGEVVY